MTRLGEMGPQGVNKTVFKLPGTFGGQMCEKNLEPRFSVICHQIWIFWIAYIIVIQKIYSFCGFKWFESWFFGVFRSNFGQKQLIFGGIFHNVTHEKILFGIFMHIGHIKTAKKVNKRFQKENSVDLCWKKC